jgi:hypothetical protein
MEASVVPEDDADAPFRLPFQPDSEGVLALQRHRDGPDIPLRREIARRHDQHSIQPDAAGGDAEVTARLVSVDDDQVEVLADPLFRDLERRVLRHGRPRRAVERTIEIERLGLDVPAAGSAQDIAKESFDVVLAAAGQAGIDEVLELAAEVQDLR